MDVVRFSSQRLLIRIAHDFYARANTVCTNAAAVNFAASVSAFH
jgi:hypothetical protein